MDDPQTATAYFFAPAAAAYLAICGLWLAYDQLRKTSGGEPAVRESDRPVVDFLLAIAAAVGIFLLGAAYRQGWLLPADGTALGRMFWIVDNAIIYSPIAIVLIARKQGPATVFLSHHRLAEKIALGFGLGVVAVAIYLALRGELLQFGACLSQSFAPDKLVNFPAIFLEGVAVAFLFVRLRWLVGTALAIAIPCALFALAHVPGQLADNSAAWEMAAFFVFNTSLTAAILWTVGRSRDVIWIGVAHYLMDIAIKAI